MRRILFVLGVLCVGGLSVGDSPGLGAFPGANGKITFDSQRSGNPDIWAMSPHGRNLVNLTDNPGFDGKSSWRPDGRKIVFQSDRVIPTNPGGSFEIFVMDADGANPTQITFTATNHNSAASWSPDGQKIVFVRQMFTPTEEAMGLSNHDVWTMNADGSDQQNLTNNPADDEAPAWSPDGSKIAFHSVRSGSNEVYTMEPNGSSLRQLTATPDFDGDANWSPDSRMIAFESNRDGNPEIYTMRADGSHPVNVTRNPAADFLAAWSPSGRNMTFSTDRDAGSENPDNVEIYTMRADGRRQVNRTNDPGFDIDSDWQPRPGGHDDND